MDVEDLVKSYFRLGFSNKEILCLLAHQHGVIISKRTLQRLCRKLNLFRRKNQTDIEEIASFVQSEMATSGWLQGYRWLHLRAIRRGYVVSQETMRIVIKEIDPKGVELLRRRQYFSRGPNVLWHYGIFGDVERAEVQLLQGWFLWFNQILHIHCF